MNWNRLLTGTLVACALVTTSLVVYRELLAPATRPAPLEQQKPVFIEHWKSELDTGARLGPPAAPVQLMEFADFECPYCRSFHKTLKALRDRYPDKVALSFVHYPLPGHRFAEPAARVAECAGEQGRFEGMHDHLFEQQNQLGMKPWREFASDASIPDLAAFESCIQKSDSVPRIEAGKHLAEQLNIQGTPTLIVNGWKLGRPPSAEELDRMVQAVLSGKSPVSEI